MSSLLICAAAALVALTNVYAAGACPFCNPPQPTLSEEIDSADVVVFAKLSESFPPPPVGSGEKFRPSKFEISHVIKGDKHVSGLKQVELVYFGEGKTGRTFLLVGVDPPKLNWSTPTLLTMESQTYITDVMKLPKSGPGRLEFFQHYLENKDEMIARDAYDEFAKAPYDDVLAMKDEMHREQLLEWILNTDIPASRRRLYLTMLGVCGTKADANLLEGMLKSEDRKVKAGLDAMIACYLRLRAEEGLPLVEQLYLKNKDAEYADTYSAIMALRFHGQEGGVIPREKVVKSMHHMLDRPELADLVIVDLARWEDWTVMDRLVELFKKADDKSSWVRVPVVRYLMACPKPAAKKHLKDLEKIDEGAVRRAKTLFPFDDAGGEDAKETS